LSKRFLRISVIVYPILMLLCGLGYTRWDSYQMDGDGVSFLDIADAIRRHDWQQVYNGYWNPAYSFAIALGSMIAKPSRWHALQIDYYVNWFIFATALAAVAYLVYALLRLRSEIAPDTAYALPGQAILLFAWSIAFYSWQNELSLAKVRSDGLLFVFFVLAAALFLHSFTTARLRYAGLLGLALAGAYLTKSVGFVASCALLALALLCLFFYRGHALQKRRLTGVLLAGFVFLLAAAPYIAGISRQRDRLTFGDSSRVLYAEFIDGMDSAHEWYTHHMGDATEKLKHHERLLQENPAVFSYDQHMWGSFPFWFDPAYWHDTTFPRFDLRPQLDVLARNLELDVVFVENHSEPLLCLLLLFALGCRLPRRSYPWAPAFVVILWGFSIFALYSLLILQPRYLSAPWLFLLVPLATSLQLKDLSLRTATTALVVLLAGICLGHAVQDIGARRRLMPIDAEYGRTGAYNPAIYSAAKALHDLGIEPGDRIACVTLRPCGFDPYWLWLSQVQMVADIAPGPASETVSPAEAAALQSIGAKAIIRDVPIGADPLPGWHRLGTSNFGYYLIPSAPAHQ